MTPNHQHGSVSSSTFLVISSAGDELLELAAVVVDLGDRSRSQTPGGGEVERAFFILIARASSFCPRWHFVQRKSRAGP